MEEDLYERIGEADLNPTYKDGQVYQHTDINNMLSILKTAINENYYDIQRLGNGSKTVGKANSLDGAALSRYLIETLQADDDKIPSSQQVKAYVDDLFAAYSPPIRGVDYWTEEDQQQIADEVPSIVEQQIEDMGPLGFNLTGNYDDTITYHKFDVVYYQGSTYAAKMDTIGNIPTNSVYWNILAAGSLKQFVYDSVASMKADNTLVDGMTVQTLGYYEVNDGGGAKYKITDEESQTEFQEELDSGLYATLVSKEVNPKTFGGINSTSADQSSYIQQAIQYCIDNDIKEIKLDGEYFVNTTISFTNISNITIKDGTLYVHETTELLANDFNPLRFSSCSNINIENIKIIETSPGERARKLYVGGIYLTGCTQCTIKNCYLENVQSGIILKSSNSKCLVDSNFVNTTYHSNQFSESAIINYASAENVISNNNIVGEYYDGTLSIYGGGCKNVIVEGNKIFNKFDNEMIYLSEGITIDGGCVDTIISKNYIQDMMYGIDNKNDCRDTLIVDNILVGNKVSITDRPGEENKQTFNCMIKNNDIRVQVDFDTSTFGNFNIYGHYFVGIYISERSSANVKGNKIYCYGAIGGLAVAGIIGIMKTGLTNQYASPFSIEYNNIDFSTGFGAITSNAGTGSTGIYLKDVTKGNITNNSFKVDTSANTYTMIYLAGTITDTLITSNLCHTTSLDNHYFVNIDEATNKTNNTIYKNKIRHYCKVIPNLGSISNIVEYKNFDFPIHKANATSLTADTYKTIAKITLRYSGAIRFKVYGMVDSSGLKYISGEYFVSVNGTTITPTTLNEEKSNLNIQFINEGTSNQISIQVKSNSSISSFGNFGIYDIVSLQPYTFVD